RTPALAGRTTGVRARVFRRARAARLDADRAGDRRGRRLLFLRAAATAAARHTRPARPRRADVVRPPTLAKPSYLPIVELVARFGQQKRGRAAPCAARR